MDEQRIRDRASYRMFKGLHEFLDSEPSEEEVLMAVWRLLDDRRAFGSRKNAATARESMELVLAEAEEGQPEP